jgi:hypothetical protein
MRDGYLRPAVQVYIHKSVSMAYTKDMESQSHYQGIMHGPYPGLSKEEVRDYIYDQIGNEVSGHIVEKLHDDVQSHHQYERHCYAVQDAIQAGRIAQPLGLSVMTHTLQPWSRNIRALYYNS